MWGIDFSLPHIILSSVICFIIVGLLAKRWLSKSQNLPPSLSYLFTIKIIAVMLIEGGLNTALRRFSHHFNREMITMKLGLTKMIMLNTCDAVKEAFVKKGDVIVGRPKIAKLRKKGYGVLATEGRTWKEQRRFTLTTLRDFGMGKIAMEDKITDEVVQVVDWLKARESKPIDIQKTLGVAVSNVICSIVFGKTYDHSDPVCSLFLDVFNKNATSGGARKGLLNIFPFLIKLPGDLFGFYAEQRRMDQVDVIIKKSIEEHKQRIDPNDINDFIDAYLVEMEAQKKKDPSSTFSDPQLLRLVFDLFIAGSETTATTLRWGIKMMMLHEDVQAKVHQEIDDVIGRERLPRMSDRQKMPYVEAVLMEIHRFATLVPLVPHRVLDDVKLMGYDIPEGAVCAANTWFIHRDKRIWPYPDSFDVRNFLDEDCNHVRREFLIPFAVGKRQCIGEGLAKMEMFLFFVTLMQRFTFKVPTGHAAPGESDEVTGFVRGPKPYMLSVESRG